MQQPPKSLISAVQRGATDARTRRDVLHYRGYFRAYDKEGKLLSTDPDKIVRIDLTPRSRKLL